MGEYAVRSWEMPTPPSEWLLAALAVGTRVLFSVGEVALVRSSRRKVRDLQRRGGGLSTSALAALLRDPEPAFASLRIGSMICLAAAATLGGLWALRWAGSASSPVGWALLGGVGTAALVFLLEAVARSLAGSAPERWGLLVAPPLLLWRACVTPVLRPMARLLDRVAAPLGIRIRFRAPDPAVDEMQRILAEAEGHHEVPPPELLRSVFELPNLIAKDVLIPRTEVVAIPTTATAEELLRIVEGADRSRFPVYEGSIDTVVGVLHLRDVATHLIRKDDAPVTTWMRPPVFVPWALRLDRLLLQLQDERIHMAMITDEHGGFLGIVTLQDVIAKVLGGLDGVVVEDGAGGFLLGASNSLARANLLFGTQLPQDEGYDTLGGFLNHLAGTIPEQGAVIDSHGLLFTVVERTKTRLIRVRVRPKPPQGVEAA